MATVNVSGPLFDGRAERALAAAVEATAVWAGPWVADQVRARVAASAVADTGAYASRLTISRTADTVVVSDRGVIYGPWLEGTSRRNQTTRFRGYAAFRRTVQHINESGAVAEHLQQEIARRGDLA